MTRKYLHAYAKAGRCPPMKKNRDCCPNIQFRTGRRMLYALKDYFFVYMNVFFKAKKEIILFLMAVRIISKDIVSQHFYWLFGGEKHSKFRNIRINIR